MLAELSRRATGLGERAIQFANQTAGRKLLPETLPADLAQQATRFGDKALKFLSNAIERSFNPQNLVLADKTPYDTVFTQDILSLRFYRPLDDETIDVEGAGIPVQRPAQRIPVVLVPPLAANTLIFDLFPTRSLVRYLTARGFNTYLIDWGEPERQHSHLRFEDYAIKMMSAALEQVRQHSGQQEVSLFGYCMGGLFCLAYAGYVHDDKLKNLITVASPIDAHQAGVAGRLFALMNRPALWVRKYTNFRIQDLSPRLTHIPGGLNALAFKLTSPLAPLKGWLDLLLNMWDREYVEEYTTYNRIWFNNMWDYPGGLVQDIFIKLSVYNTMNRGKFTLADGKVAKLERINCSFLAFGGLSDNLVPIKAARRVMDLISSEDKQFMEVPGGHAGVFCSSVAPTNTWKISADWLAERSN
ncbi:MAG: alpha/beta fold hydrolase [Nevskiales bacterium]